METFLHYWLSVRGIHRSPDHHRIPLTKDQRCCESEPEVLHYNERDGVSNHQTHDCLLNRLFRRRSKKSSKLFVISLCEAVTGEFPAQGPVTRKMFPLYYGAWATEIILCMRAANERRRYIVTSYLIGWAHTQIDHCCYYKCMGLMKATLHLMWDEYFLHTKPWIPGGEKSIFTAVIHQWRSLLRQFARAATIGEYDVTMPVRYVRVTSQINRGDLTILSQKRPSLATMAKSAIDNCF